MCLRLWHISGKRDILISKEMIEKGEPMKIHFNTSALEPMIDWLMDRKRTGRGDEDRLREVLSHPDYQVELLRYADPGLPVCGISLEEAVDFFMNFDAKDFENPRLQYKKESFRAFYDDLENRCKSIGAFVSMAPEDYALMETLLKNGLPDEMFDQIPELNVIFIVSIGNSMGWPYGHYIDYDVANLTAFRNKADFVHITAHEIHHVFTGPLLAPEGIRGEDFFLQNFAFEGLAVHYMNNLATVDKRAKYDDCTYVMDERDMAFYEAHFDEIFDMIRNDYRACIGRSLDEVKELVAGRYEQFSFLGREIRQYPTYYFGCYMWGLVDLVYGKEKVYEAIAKPELFVPLYNAAAQEKHRL